MSPLICHQATTVSTGCHRIKSHWKKYTGCIIWNLILQNIVFSFSAAALLRVFNKLSSVCKNCWMEFNNVDNIFVNILHKIQNNPWSKKIGKAKMLKASVCLVFMWQIFFRLKRRLTGGNHLYKLVSKYLQ